LRKVTSARAWHTEHGQVARALAWGIVFVALAKIAGAAKEVVVAARYGTSDAIDAYLLIFNVINWPLGVWLSILPSALIPLVARASGESPSVNRRFAEELFGFVFLFGLGLAFLGWLLLPGVLRASGLSADAMVLAEGMIAPMALLLPMGALNILLATRLLAHGSQLNTLMEGIPALVLVVFLIFGASGDPRALVWGTVTGFAVQSAALLTRIGAGGELPIPRLGFGSAPWRSFWKAVAIIGVGQALMSFTMVVDQFMASHIGPGSIAALGYADRVIALVIGLGATAALRATLPVFADVSPEKSENLRQFALYWTKVLFLCGFAAAVLGWIIAPWAIKVLFQRGAFTENDVIAVTEVLRYGLFQIPFYFGGVVLTSLMAAQRRYSVIAYIAGASLIVKVVGNLVFAPGLGIKGLALATSLMYATAFGARAWAVLKSSRGPMA
jgi:putative peptidoglycan lipid II flippase